MPVVEVTMIEGRTFEAKVDMVEKVTDAIVTSLSVKPEAVRVIIREVPAYHFAAGGVLKGKPPGK
jgi:4-oxalocrotonate tautomerase